MLTDKSIHDVIRRALTIPSKPGPEYSDDVICSVNGCTHWGDYPYGVYLKDGRFSCPDCIHFFEIPRSEIDGG